MDFSQYVFGTPYFGWLCRGLEMTLSIALASSIMAIGIGFLVLRWHTSRHRLCMAAGAAFVLTFRNLPLLPLLLLVTFVVPGVWRDFTGTPFLDDYEIGLLLLVLSLNSGAYLAEILFAGVTAVAPEQVQAARVLGMQGTRIRRHIVYPQAMRIVAPALASRLIHNLKNSTLAIVVPLPVESMEIVGQAGRIAGQTFSWAEPLSFASCVHLSLALCLGWFLNRWAIREQAKVRGSVQ